MRLVVSHAHAQATRPHARQTLAQGETADSAEAYHTLALCTFYSNRLAEAKALVERWARARCLSSCESSWGRAGEDTSELRGRQQSATKRAALRLPERSIFLPPAVSHVP